MNPFSNLLLFLGAVLLLGVIADHFFRKIRLPAAAAYLSVGIVLGETGFGWGGEFYRELELFSIFPIGVLAFMAGTTVKYRTLARHGRGLLLLGFGGGAIASVLTGLAAFFLLAAFNSEESAIRGACLLAPLGAAIGPWTIRSTLDDAKARGPVTAALNAVTDLGFLPLVVMYGLFKIVLLCLYSSDGGLLTEQILLKLGGSVLFGGFFGIILPAALKLASGGRKAAVLILSMIVLCTSFAGLGGLDVALTVFVFGVMAVNFRPSGAGPEGLEMVKDWHLFLYMIMLAALAGGVDLPGIPAMGWGMIGCFVVCCCIARAAGIWLMGGDFEHSSTIRGYLCLGALPQSAFAVVLILSAGGGELALKIGVLSMLILQLVGPLCTRLALGLAGESGRNITDEDLMKEMTAGEVMIRNYGFVSENEPAHRVLERFASGERQVYPVVTQDHELVGVLNFESLRGILSNNDSWKWLVAADLMVPAGERVMAGEPLSGVYRRLEAAKGQIPVMDDENNYKLIGMLDLNAVRMKVRSEILCRNHHKG
jgi:NhaP-type Na+/H+ or K+/H+ antiporter/CBS domain-containing protein